MTVHVLMIMINQLSREVDFAADFARRRCLVVEVTSVASPEITLEPHAEVTDCESKKTEAINKIYNTVEL